MKIPMNWLMVAVLAMGLAGCKKNAEVKAPQGSPIVTAVPAPAPQLAPPPAPKAPGLTVAERAAKLGFVKYLSPDTEVVLSFQQGDKSVKRIQSSKLWKLIQAETGMKADDESAADGKPPTDAPTAEVADPAGPAALFGTEFTIALGKSAGEQAANLFTFNRRMGYFQMRALAKAFVAAAKEGDFTTLSETMDNQYGPELFKDLLADPKSGVDLIERLQMPPLYLAFRTSEAARPAAAQQLAGLVGNLAMVGDMVEPVTIEQAGQKFAGMKISGAKISAAMDKERKEMEDMLEPAAVDKLLAAIAKKDLVVVSGIIGDYAILFFGASDDDLKLATDPGQSLVAGNALSFVDAYATKDLAAVIYSQKGALDKLQAAAAGLSDMAGGLRDGLAGSDGLGDTRDLEALLRMVGEREAALRKLAGNETLGLTAFFEDGLKIESYGGPDTGAVDWKASNKLAALGAADDVVMFANMTGEAAYDEQARAYLEALMETSYAVAMKVAEAKVDDAKIAKFKAMATMFDSKFRPDVVALWDTLSGDCKGSLGRERACIVDLNGSVPAIPGIPQEVVDGGKFPRIAVIAPVTDRAKLAASWQKINVSATNILAKVSELTGKDIPMQKPISSEKEAYTTWFFSLPFFNDDFMPSVTVGDQWFAASTSKTQALDLLNKAAKGGETRTGLYFTMNFKALQKFSRATYQVLDKNSAAIFRDAIPTDRMKTASKFITALDDLDKLTVHARRENGVLRSSVHLKTR